MNFALKHDELEGAIRPEYDVHDVEKGEPAEVGGHCFFSAFNGRLWPGNHEWEGMPERGESKRGDRIGMLLDLDQGSMTVWKNDLKLGVMQAEGLSGPLCWAAELGVRGASARIESALAPASATDEELTAAKVRKNEEFCIQNEECCIQNDEFCRKPQKRWRVGYAVRSWACR